MPELHNKRMVMPAEREREREKSCIEEFEPKSPLESHAADPG